MFVICDVMCTGLSTYLQLTRVTGMGGNGENCWKCFVNVRNLELFNDQCLSGFDILKAISSPNQC